MIGFFITSRLRKPPHPRGLFFPFRPIVPFRYKVKHSNECVVYSAIVTKYNKEKIMNRVKEICKKLKEHNIPYKIKKWSSRSMIFHHILYKISILVPYKYRQKALNVIRGKHHNNVSPDDIYKKMAIMEKQKAHYEEEIKKLRSKMAILEKKLAEKNKLQHTNVSKSSEVLIPKGDIYNAPKKGNKALKLAVLAGAAAAGYMLLNKH